LTWWAPWIVDSPSAEGGVDYATLVRGDPWDMSQSSDILAPENMIYGFGSGVLNGLSAGPHIDDAHFTLPLNGQIDGNRFHRLTFNVYYDGPFGLGAGPGGGMVARLIWETVGSPGVWQNSDDIVVYPGWNKVSVDLATNPSWAITDPDTPIRIGWAGQQIRTVRFDPDEDSGQRRFLVDNIKIAEDATLMTRVDVAIALSVQCVQSVTYNAALPELAAKVCAHGADAIAGVADADLSQRRIGRALAHEVEHAGRVGGPVE